MNIVTEYGIAELHDQPVRERVKRTIGIAAPTGPSKAGAGSRSHPSL